MLDADTQCKPPVIYSISEDSAQESACLGPATPYVGWLEDDDLPGDEAGPAPMCKEKIYLFLLPSFELWQRPTVASPYK